MNWEIKKYDELTTDELYEILKLRFEVFVCEQKCMDLDLDDKDQLSVHMFVRDKDKIIACLRIIPKGVSYDEASLGRFAVQKEYRKNGIGRKGIEKAINYIFDEWQEAAIRISGQAYLHNFYCSFGFKETKGPYMEDNIPHYEFILEK